MASTFWVPGNGSGKFSSAVDKLGIHTTEGGSIEGAVAAYRSGNSWPHDTVDFRFGKPYRICRHLDYDQGARSFKNEPGGVQTNADGVIQVEVVGFATNPSQIDWEAFAREYAGPVCSLNRIPVQSSVRWVPYPASYGVGASQRLSAAAWTAYKGILGHQHVPENSHGDPGAVPIEVILRSAGGDDLPTPADVWNHPVKNALKPEGANMDPAHVLLTFSHERASKAVELIEKLSAAVLTLPDAVWDAEVYEQINDVNVLARQMLGGAHLHAFNADEQTKPPAG